tara:strand:+ start:1095 stop:1874 length:780 start_codon:yes stop_codon:yes gene_type:complete
MPKKSLGQNFLNDNQTLNTIIESGEISKNDVVLEIGPGTGKLTQKILEKNPKHLVVVEKDRNLVQLLKKQYGRKIEIINDDILNCYNKIDFNIPIKVFGNLPYNISSKILTSYIKIDNLENKFKKFIFVFQKEVADRILASENTKNYGRLSILTSWKMNKKKIINIDPKYFYPKPKVWSSLITLTPKLNYEYLKKSKNLEYITKIFFNQRRKMIKKPMRQLFYDFEDVAKKLKIDLTVRPQNLSKEKYLDICKLYENLS